MKKIRRQKVKPTLPAYSWEKISKSVLLQRLALWWNDHGEISVKDTQLIARYSILIRNTTLCFEYKLLCHRFYLDSQIYWHNAASTYRCTDIVHIFCESLWFWCSVYSSLVFFPVHSYYTSCDVLLFYKHESRLHNSQEQSVVDKADYYLACSKTVSNESCTY